MTDAVAVMSAFSDLVIETQPMPAGPEGEVKRAESPRGGWKSPQSRREAADELLNRESPANRVATAVDLALPERDAPLQERSGRGASPGGGRANRPGSRPKSRPGTSSQSGSSTRPTTEGGVQIAIVLPAVAADAAATTPLDDASGAAPPAAAAGDADGTPSPYVVPPLSQISAVDILLPDEAASPTRARTASSAARPGTGASRALCTASARSTTQRQGSCATDRSFLSMCTRTCLA